MFTIIGGVMDRYWPIALTVIGVAALAVVSALWQPISSGAGLFLTVAVICLCAVASVAGGVVSNVKQVRESSKVESDMLTAIRSTLIPVSERLIAENKPILGKALEDCATELTLHLRSLVKGDPARSDVNLYQLEKDGLSLVNRAARDARRSFKSDGRRKGAAADEERATVRRVVDGEATFCPDVKRAKWRKRYCLDDRAREYRAFISVPIKDADGKSIGMLSINSADTGVLTSVHEKYLVAAAKLYSVAISVKRT